MDQLERFLLIASGDDLAGALSSPASQARPRGTRRAGWMLCGCPLWAAAGPARARPSGYAVRSPSLRDTDAAREQLGPARPATQQRDVTGAARAAQWPAPWTSERTAYLGSVLQTMLRGYTEAAVSFTTALVKFISRFAVQARARPVAQGLAQIGCLGSRARRGRPLPRRMGPARRARAARAGGR